MRVCPVFPALHLYPSDSTRQHPRRAGMRGLRHKSRHKSALSKYGNGHFAGTPAEMCKHPLRKSEYGEFACASGYESGRYFLRGTVCQAVEWLYPDSSGPLPELECPGQFSMSPRAVFGVVRCTTTVRGERPRQFPHSLHWCHCSVGVSHRRKGGVQRCGVTTALHPPAIPVLESGQPRHAFRAWGTVEQR